MKLVKAQRNKTKPSKTIAKIPSYVKKVSSSKGAIDISRKRIYGLAFVVGAKGGDIKDLAKRLGVTQYMLSKYLDEDEEIGKAFGRGVDMVRYRVEQAMVKRACGFKVPRTTTSTVTDSTGKIITKTVVKTEDHILGDPGLQKWFLSKRNKERYGESERESGPLVVINMDKSDENI